MRPRRPVPAAVLAVVLAAVLAAAPASALDVFLDAGADGDPDTFVNTVIGPVSAPVDIIVSFDEGDLGLSQLQLLVAWGFGGTDPKNPGCSDILGRITYEPWMPLPDRGPFTNIVPYSCVCRGLRCFCDSQMWVDVDVSSPTAGNHVLATLEFSREGTSIEECGQPVEWPTAVFVAQCGAIPCDNPSDPRATLTIAATGTSVEPPEFRSWGRAKAAYR